MNMPTQTLQDRIPMTSSRYIITAAAVLIYAIVLAVMLARTGSGATAALAILPAVAGGWLLGTRGGIATAVVSLFISLLIFIWLKDAITFLRDGAFGNLLVLTLGAASGWLSELLAKVRQQALDLQREIDEREKAEQARRETEARLNTVLENAPIMLWAVDADQTITVLRGQVLRTLNFGSAELIGQPISTLYDGIPGMAGDMRRALNGERVRATRNVADLIFDTRYVPLKDESGRLMGVIGVAIDITEQQKTKAALGEAQTDLETKNQQLERVNEYFRATLDQLLDTANRGGDINEISVYLRQVETEFQRLA